MKREGGGPHLELGNRHGGGTEVGSKKKHLGLSGLSGRNRSATGVVEGLLLTKKNTGKKLSHAPKIPHSTKAKQLRTA